jgi:predicted thioredoxin/glutaredoxin
MKLILASASWCGPCQVVKARLQSENLSDRIEVKDADTDISFFKDHGIKSVPRLLVIDGETVVETVQGTENIIKRIKQDQ